MSVPKSRVIRCGSTHEYPNVETLSVSKGLMALTDLKNNCPSTNNSQTIYVNVNSNKAQKEVEHENKNENKHETERKAVVDGEELSDVVIVNPNESNPYSSLRDVSNMDDIRNQFKQLQQVIKEKENMAMALSIMLNLVENNPLIINKYIIASRDCLIELLKLLTGGEDISINEVVSDVGCSCNSVEYSLIDKIYVIKDGQIYVLKYSFPDAVKILDDHKISIKMCCDG